MLVVRGMNLLADVFSITAYAAAQSMIVHSISQCSFLLSSTLMIVFYVEKQFALLLTS